MVSKGAAVGLALREQIIDEVPVGESDVRYGNSKISSFDAEILLILHLMPTDWTVSCSQTSEDVL